MAQAEYVTSAIRVLITDARAKPSTNPVRAAQSELVAALAGHPPRPIPLDPDGLDLQDRVDHLNKVLTALSAYLTAILDDTAQNVPGGLDLRHVDALLSDLTSDVAGSIQLRRREHGKEDRMTVRFKPADRHNLIGGSDARIIMGEDEAALLRMWREKRGEVEPEDLSGNLIVQLGVVTEPLNRHWFERNPGRHGLRPNHISAHKRLFVVFDFKRFPEPHSRPSPVLVDELDAGGLQSQAYLGPCFVTAAQGAVLSLQPLYRRNRHVGCNCQLLLRPSQQCARSLNLPD